MFDQLGGSAVVHNDCYWYMWPNDGEVWCYDIHRESWSFHEQRVQIQEGDEVSTRASVIAASLDRFPVFQYPIFADGWFTNRLAPIHKWRGFNDEYGGNLNSNPMFVLPGIEFGAIGGDRSPKRVRYFVVDVESGWINDSDDNDQNVLGIEIVNESGDIISSSFTQSTDDAGRITRLIVDMPDAPYVQTLRAKMFGCRRDLNRIVDYPDVATPADGHTFLRVHSAGWYAEGELPPFSETELDSMTPVTSAAHFDRFELNPAVSQVEFPFDTNGTSAFVNVSSSYFRAISSATAAVAALTSPLLRGVNQWEIRYRLGNGSGVGTATVDLALFSDFTNLSKVGATVSIARISPLRVSIGSVGGQLRMTVQYYVGIDGSQITRSLDMGAIASADAQIQRFRIVRVPGTSTFFIDHTDIGTEDYASDPDVTNRIIAQVVGRLGEVPLNPYMGMTSDAGDIETARILQGLFKPLTTVLS